MDIETITQAADAYLASAAGSAAARLRFLEGVWAIQATIEGHERSYTAPDPQVAREALVTGQPLFLAAPPEVPRDAYLDAVRAIAGHVVTAAGLETEQADALAAVDFEAAITQERLAAAVREPEAFFATVADEVCLGAAGVLSPATITFVLASALVPFLTTASALALGVVEASDLETWGSGRCPVCGSAAAMGRMGERTELKGAQRALWCGLCHTEWRYERIRCVRCGTQNPDQLRYTYVEGDPAHRLHLCDACHGYVRVVFEDDVRARVSMPVEDAVSTSLEAVARANGYTPEGLEVT